MMKLVGPDNDKLKTVCVYSDIKKAVKWGNNLTSYAKSHQCLGLSANQFGITERVCVAKIDGTWRIFINPKIVDSFGSQLSKAEGCLSFPGVRGDIKRAQCIGVSFIVVDKWDQQHRYETFSDFNVIILEHEIDHLDGIRCIDKMVNKKYE